jgi:hypothetical protein
MEMSRELVSTMTVTTDTTTNQPKSSAPGWIVLTAGSVGAFIVGALTQVAVFVGLGLCMDESPATCAPGTYPTTAEHLLATVPTYLMWMVPAVIAIFLGRRALRSGNPMGRWVAICSGILMALITVAAALMWWV